jgi:hypothetical protein
MHKNYLIYMCLLPLLAMPVGVMAKDSDWLVVTLYPSQGVYSANELSNLVLTIESLWTLEDDKNRQFIRNIDSLATENTIVAQGDSIRFRRLIEQRELTDSGLVTLKSIVNEHPLLQHRMADSVGESLNIWVKLRYEYNQQEQRLLLSKITDSLQAQYQNCSVSNKGPLIGMSLQAVDLEPRESNTILTTFNQLAVISSGYGEGALQNYSAVDLLSILNHSMNPNQKITSSEQVEQLYMIAESVRSRHLHSLASPSFKRFKLMRIIESGATFPPISKFNIIRTNTWSANESNYQVLECRTEASLIQTEQY